MSNIAITPAKILAYNTVVADFPAAAATSAVVDTPEVFEFTPSRGCQKVAVFVTVANTHGTVVCSAGAGVFWAGKALPFNAVQNKTSVIQLETAPIKRADGKVFLTLTPASGKRLATDHAAKVQVVELI